MMVFLSILYWIWRSTWGDLRSFWASQILLTRAANFKNRWPFRKFSCPKLHEARQLISFLISAMATEDSSVPALFRALNLEPPSVKHLQRVRDSYPWTNASSQWQCSQRPEETARDRKDWWRTDKEMTRGDRGVRGAEIFGDWGWSLETVGWVGPRIDVVVLKKAIQSIQLWSSWLSDRLTQTQFRNLPKMRRVSWLAMIM